MKAFFVCCRCLSLTLIESSRNFLSKLKRINRAWSYEIDEMSRTLRIFVPFFSILFPILFRMIFERTLLFQSETRTSRICGFNNTVGYTVFVSLKVRTFEFFPIIRSCLEPWDTQKFTHHVSIHFKKSLFYRVYNACLLHSRKTRSKVSYLHSSVEKFIVFGEILEASKAIGVA